MEITKEFLEKSPLYIAEVGQNHQGSLDYILEYIDVFSRAGANAIKFQNEIINFSLMKQNFKSHMIMKTLWIHLWPTPRAFGAKD